MNLRKNQIFYLNDMPIPKPNFVSHNLSFCEKQYCRRIWGRERQNQLTGDHLNKLTHHSNKNGRGWEIRTPIDSFGDCSPSRWTNPLWWKGAFILKHLKLDGAPLPVTARAYTGLPGGRNKIRTCGGVTLAAFPRRCFKPLSHSSINKWWALTRHSFNYPTTR